MLFDVTISQKSRPCDGCKQMWSLITRSSVLVKKHQHGKKLSLCLQRSPDALWALATLFLTNSKTLCETCTWRDYMQMCSFPILCATPAAKKNATHPKCWPLGRDILPSILSFSGGISACGKAEKWQEMLHLLAMSEHLEQEAVPNDSARRRNHQETNCDVEE